MMVSSPKKSTFSSMIGSPLKVAIHSPGTIRNAARVANLPKRTGPPTKNYTRETKKRAPRGSTVAGSDAADLKRLRKAHVNRTAKMHNLSNHGRFKKGVYVINHKHIIKRLHI